MPSLYRMKRSIAAIDWLGIARILVIQVIIVFVLSLAAMRYLTWTSDMAQAEFARAIGQAVAEDKSTAMQETTGAISLMSQHDTAGCARQMGRAVPPAR